MLASPLALAYFMEFLETKDMKHLVDFWLAVQAFKVVATERCRLNSNESLSKKQISNKRENNSINQSSEGLNGRDFCSECRSLQGASGSEHNVNDEQFTNWLTATTANHHVNGEKSESGNSQNCQKSRNTFKRSLQKEDVLTGFAFSGNWEPFSNEDPAKSEMISSQDQRTENKDSYVARRIMSKQTRNRTKSRFS